MTTLDVVRAYMFTSSLTGSKVEDAQIPVIAGHTGVTILPFFTQCSVGQLVPEDELAAEVVLAEAGIGSATLSTTHSSAHLESAVVNGLAGWDRLLLIFFRDTDGTYSFARGKGEKQRIPKQSF